MLYFLHGYEFDRHGGQWYGSSADRGFAGTCSGHDDRGLLLAQTTRNEGADRYEAFDGLLVKQNGRENGLGSREMSISGQTFWANAGLSRCQTRSLEIREMRGIDAPRKILSATQTPKPTKFSNLVNNFDGKRKKKVWGLFFSRQHLSVTHMLHKGVLPSECEERIAREVETLRPL